MSGETAFLSVDELGAGFRSGSMTPLQVAEQAFERIDRLNAKLNAFADPMRTAALAEAAERTAELAAGHDRGPLHGVPVAVKDLIEVRGAATGYGSLVRAPATGRVDAELVHRLRGAGAVILGKTNLLEYAYGVAHPEIGQTNNPHDLARTSGGSSGGSAAAVAAGIVPLAIGTDTGGSIRIPAAYCGIVGMKPSFGLLPLDGVFPLSPSLDHAGPLARTAKDAMLALECLSGGSMRHERVSLATLRIGLLQQHFRPDAVSPGVRECLNEAVERLRSAGAAVFEVEIPNLERVNGELVKILLPEAALVHAELHAENAAGYAAGTRSQIEAGLAASAVDYLSAQRFREELRDHVEARFTTVDVLLSPSIPFVAPAEDPEFIEGGDDEILSSGLANMTGHPALSLPCGFVNGLPVGLQLTGRLGTDHKLLVMASRAEEVIDGYRRPAL